MSVQPRKRSLIEELRTPSKIEQLEIYTGQSTYVSTQDVNGSWNSCAACLRLFVFVDLISLTGCQKQVLFQAVLLGI
jgi:hypothetical protein